MALTDLQIKRFSPAAKPYKRADGGGLFIQVMPNNSKLWRMSYRVDGKQKLLSFGAYPYVTLASARKKRDEAKTLLAEGIDPMAVKKAAKAKRIAETEHTFAKIAACPSPLNLGQIDLSGFGGSGRIEDGSEAVFG